MREKDDPLFHTKKPTINNPPSKLVIKSSSQTRQKLQVETSELQKCPNPLGFIPKTGPRDVPTRSCSGQSWGRSTPSCRIRKNPRPRRLRSICHKRSLPILIQQIIGSPKWFKLSNDSFETQVDPLWDDIIKTFDLKKKWFLRFRLAPP